MSYEMVMTREQIDKDRKAWLEKRKTGIGGSDAGVIIGVSHWNSPFGLWMEKTGQMESEDKSDVESIKWGNRLEDAVADAFVEEYGKKVRKCGMVRSKEYPFMLADPDRLIVGENALLEIKTTGYGGADDWEDDSLPDTYYCQILHYMIVLGCEKAYVYCLIAGQKAILREVNFNKEDAEALIEAERIFWEENVQQMKMPDVDGSNKCTEALRKKFNNSDGEEAELDETINLLLDDRAKYEAQVKSLEDEIQKIENKVRVLMSNSPYGTTSDYKITFKVQHRSGFDKKKLEQDYPDIYKHYVTDQVTRPLRISLRKKSKKGAN